MDDSKPSVAGDEPPAVDPDPLQTSATAPLGWGIAPQDSPVQPPAIPDMPVSETPVDQPMSDQIPAIPETPPVPATEETFVIPPATPNSNPFIPQGVTPSDQPGISPPPSGSSFVKKLIMVFMFLLLLAGVGFGIKYFLGKGSVSGVTEATITYWGLWEDGPILEKIIADFHSANPKITVQYAKQSPRQYRERLEAAIARGDGPDVFHFHNTWVPMLRKDLFPAPATILTTADFNSSFYPVASSDLIGGQTIYGVPLNFEGLGLYYNEDLFTSAGVSPPTTWPELLEIVPRLTVKTESLIQQSAIALGTTGNIENFSDIVALMMMQNGANLTNPVGKEAEDTLMFYRKFANPVDPVYTWNETMDNSIYAFASGKVAMILAPSWRVFDVKQINPDIHFKIAPVPQLPGNTINWASYWAGGVSTKSKNQVAAWTFLKYLSGRDTMTKLYEEEAKTRLFGEPYALVELGSTLQTDPYVGAYIQEARTAKSFPLASRTFDNGINDKLIKYLMDAVNAVGQGTAPSEALKTASAGFSQVLTSYGLTTGAAPATTQ